MEENNKIIQGQSADMNQHHSVNGKDIEKFFDNKDWFQPIENGRKMEVGTITIHEGNDTFSMRAVIDGKEMSREITAEQYKLFVRLDDANRLKLFDVVFPEVQIKNADGKDNFNKVDGVFLLSLTKEIGFYYNVPNGREVDITEIRVDENGEEKYSMSAIVNGRKKTVGISKKTYDDFLTVDDNERVRLFIRSFKTLKTKARPVQDDGNDKKEDEDNGMSFWAKIFSHFGLCPVSEAERLKKTIAKLEERNKELVARHTAEMKRLRMNMAAIEQQREGIKEMEANWKEIRARWEDYEKFVGPEQLAKLKKNK